MLKSVLNNVVRNECEIENIRNYIHKYIHLNRIKSIYSFFMNKKLYSYNSRLHIHYSFILFIRILNIFTGHLDLVTTSGFRNYVGEIMSVLTNCRLSETPFLNQAHIRYHS